MQKVQEKGINHDLVLLKAPTPTEKSKKQRDNTKTSQIFDFTTIADLLNTVSLG